MNVTYKSSNITLFLSTDLVSVPEISSNAKRAEIYLQIDYSFRKIMSYLLGISALFSLADNGGHVRWRTINNFIHQVFNIILNTKMLSNETNRSSSETLFEGSSSVYKISV